MFPAKAIEWQNAIIESFFWGTVNIITFSAIVFLPVCILWICGIRFWSASWVIVVFISLILWAIGMPIVWVYWISKIPILKRFCLHPIPTAWDYYFFKCEPCLVIVHLKNGKLIGGLYGTKSYTSSYPEKMSIYLEQLIYIDDNGKFIRYVKGSKGALLDSDTFDYLEFLSFKLKEI
jgi:hypothetical protein